MKVYVLRERWGRYILSPRPPRRSIIPKEPIVVAGMPIHLVDWGEWSVRPFAERVIIWNFLAKIALDTLGLTGTQAIAWIQAQINAGIAFDLAWGLWTWAGAIALYFGVGFVLAYIAPAERSHIAEEVFPWRYLFRYEQRVWAADLVSVDIYRRPSYQICSEIGDIIVGENRMESTPWGVLDHWDTGHLWVQRKERFLHNEAWFWNNVWVQYIGLTTRTGSNLFRLRKGYVDPYIKEAPSGLKISPGFVCREWSPLYRMP